MKLILQKLKENKVRSSLLVLTTISTILRLQLILRFNIGFIFAIFKNKWINSIGCLIQAYILYENYRILDKNIETPVFTPPVFCVVLSPQNRHTQL